MHKFTYAFLSTNNNLHPSGGRTGLVSERFGGNRVPFPARIGCEHNEGFMTASPSHPQTIKTPSGL